VPLFGREIEDALQLADQRMKVGIVGGDHSGARSSTRELAWSRGVPKARSASRFSSWTLSNGLLGRLQRHALLFKEAHDAPSSDQNSGAAPPSQTAPNSRPSSTLARGPHAMRYGRGSGRPIGDGPHDQRVQRPPLSGNRERGSARVRPKAWWWRQSLANRSPRLSSLHQGKVQGKNRFDLRRRRTWQRIFTR
jgi:hypothetical protein